jgi:hypothetical protein
VSQVPAVRKLVGEAASQTQSDPDINVFHLEPRCRVCRNDHARKTVNELLATGSSYASIVRALGADGDDVDARDRVTIDSVRTHSARHFPVQQVARAAYREIVERRARENRADFVEGVATALTPLAFYEVVMNKAFRNLVDDNTEISVDTGLRAAEKLQSHLDRQDQSANIAKMIVGVNRMVEAVKSTVPEAMWDVIAEKLRDEHPDRLDAAEATTDADDSEDVFDPAGIDDVDDDL